MLNVAAAAAAVMNKLISLAVFHLAEAVVIVHVLPCFEADKYSHRDKYTHTHKTTTNFHAGKSRKLNKQNPVQSSGPA